MVTRSDVARRFPPPTFKEATASAAKCAQKASDDVIKLYRDRSYQTEEDITAALMMKMHDLMNFEINGLKWTFSILKRSRGRGAQESIFGADMLIHVEMNTQIQQYSKGVLIQAKRKEKSSYFGRKAHEELVGQCEKMLSVTPSSFVFNYEKSGIRCGSATRIAGDKTQDLHSCCDWTFYRFFRELFRCPIGDPRITSNSVEELIVKNIVKITANGILSEEKAG